VRTFLPPLMQRSDYESFADHDPRCAAVHDAFQRRMEPSNFNYEYFAALITSLRSLGNCDRAIGELAFALLQCFPDRTSVAEARSVLEHAPANEPLAAQAAALANQMARTRPTAWPTRVNWSVYNRCPMVCVGCYNPFVTGQLTLAECTTILAKLASVGVRSVMVAGGDPLLWSDLEEFARVARGMGLELGLDTTAVTLTEQKAQAIASLFSTIAVPLDGVSRRTSGVFRKAPSLDLPERATSALRLLRSAGAQHVRLHTVVTRENIEDLPELAGYLAGTGVSQWILFQWWGRRAARRDAARLTVETETFLALRQRLQPLLHGTKLLLSEAQSRAMTNLFIRSDGVVVTFGAGRNEEFMIGDLLRHSCPAIAASPALDGGALLTTLLYQPGAVPSSEPADTV
jgi:organic radical activating enzyme